MKDGDRWLIAFVLHFFLRICFYSFIKERETYLNKLHLSFVYTLLLAWVSVLLAYLHISYTREAVTSPIRISVSLTVTLADICSLITGKGVDRI